MLAEHAAELASRGWHVFPCRPGNKRPAVDRWEERACADPQRVAPHWPAGANIGLACGPSGLVVVDLDTHGTLPDEWRVARGRRRRPVPPPPLAWGAPARPPPPAAAPPLRDEIAAGRARLDDGELLVRAAVEAGINGGERYARSQVKHVLGGAW